MPKARYSLDTGLAILYTYPLRHRPLYRLVRRKSAQPSVCRRADRLARRVIGSWRVETDPISGPYLVPCRVTVTGAFAVMMVLLMLFLFAPLIMNPFIYFQF